MGELTHQRAVDRADEPALIDEDGTTTFAELDERVNRLIHALRDRGIRAGDTVAAVLGNRREVFEVVSACLQSSLVLVPVNFHFSPEEVAYVIADSGAKVLVSDAWLGDLGAASAARPEAAAVLTCRISVGDEGEPPAGFEAYERVVASGDPSEPADQAAGIVMFYTSGTTGRPKGVRSTKVGGSLELSKLAAAGFCAAFTIPPTGVTLLCGPWYHSAQFAWSVLPANMGSTVVSHRRFDAEEVLRAVEQHRVTNVHLVPTQMVRLLALPEDVRDKLDLSSLAIVWHGAAPCSPDVKRRTIDWLGPIVSEYYGATEGGVISIITSEDWLDHQGSVGKILPTQECIVVGESDERLDVGETGRLYFRSRDGRDFEYHGEPEKTAGAHLEPGVYTFGDVGHVDADGYLWITDRVIDMIISGGVNIYPAEIEAVLQAHPAVADVCVIGVPNTEFGEEVKAVVQVLPGFTPSDALTGELAALAREHLAGYKVPRSFDYADDLPRSAAGKLQKRKLRDGYWADAGRKM
jgi:long-chain acyl-CoA synthetase